jgi:hypothetical protein
MPDIRRIVLHDAPAMIPGFPSQPHMKLCTETIVETLRKVMAEGCPCSKCVRLRNRAADDSDRQFMSGEQTSDTTATRLSWMVLGLRTSKRRSCCSRC